MQFVAVLSLLALSAVQVQAGDSGSSSPANTKTTTSGGAAPTVAVIPTDISSGCSSFLAQLNNDSSVQACLSPILSATSAFTPTNLPDATQLSSALSTLCAPAVAAACPQTLLRSQLASFQSACSAELTNSPEGTVRAFYDFLFSITPFQQAVCSKDSTGKYCVQQIGSVNGASANDGAISGYIQLAKSWLSSVFALPLARRGASNSTAAAYSPNATTYATTGLPYLFLTPSSPSAELCSACAQAVLAPYVTFETAVPYAFGINNSPLLGKQSTLWSAISSGCGGSVTGSISQNAGASLDGAAGALGSGATTVKAGSIGLLGALVGLVAMAASL
ncbi:hypothetical protein SISSUDRAFT_1043341 [Sistotremastrum suecicum HHB10207 ss-3]|uniref:DUF7729 domain-containing protein n=1 Tax=Sistotremastrum suecicum HHB10207 ss-3 TaxID=1314776 RepID=A0A166FVK1_9AGAM|nr:hypothetical protein SISSUDRAFT_1043341 [Sistotremastrum suecicum HHB10207 ss-3]